MDKQNIKLKHILFLLLLFVVSTLVIDYIRISGYETVKMNPNKKYDNAQNQIQWELANGKTITNWNRLDSTLEFIKKEYDCSDFRLVNLIRILYEAEDKIPIDYKEKIEDVLFGFRYWWDVPGVNSMCYWTENHQILFASAEYLVGQKYPKKVFKNSGLTGKQHMNKAKKRALDWLEMRWNYGFIEYYSSVYYKEDIGALINLIDFAQDEELVKKSQIIMDLLFYDVAAQNIKTMFISTSGRAYSRNRTGSSGSRFSGIPNYFWGDGTPIKSGIMYGMINSKKYKLPPVLAKIAKDTSEVIIKQSNGLNISELKSEGYYGTDNRSMMMQWGMQAFSNPEVVRNTMAHIRNSVSFSNASVAPLKSLDLSLFKWFHLEPAIMRFINPQSNGIAIQKGNTYTYKTKDYTMYSSQNYHPGTYSYQQHVFGMNINNHFAIFHTHPAIKKDKKNHSPNYEVGYGHLPHVAQDRNISLAIYNIPEKKGMMEMDLMGFTRAYFPSKKFDTTIVKNNYVFGKKGETYCAFIGLNNFYYAEDSDDDIIQSGKQSFWITEAGSKSQDGAFNDFIKRVRTNKFKFNIKNLTLKYQSKGNTYTHQFKGEFKINDTVINTNYKRFDSPYVKAKRKAKTLTFKFNDDTLFLDFKNQIRNFND